MDYVKGLPADEQTYILKHLPKHLFEAGQFERLHNLLTDFDFIQRKILAFKTQSLLNDYEFIPPDNTILTSLKKVINQNAHLFDQCERLNDLIATLYSRFYALPELHILSQNLKECLTSPYLIPLHPLPDLPHPLLHRTLFGHTEWVVGCAISADGNVIVSDSQDGFIKIWDAETGTERLSLAGLRKTGRFKGCCSISKDGTLVAAISEDGVNIWDISSSPHSPYIRFTLPLSEFNTTYKINTSAGIIFFNSLKFWDIQSGKEYLTLTGTGYTVMDCDLSDDGKIFIAAFGNRILKLWNLEQGTERLIDTSHERVINSCAINADGTIAVTGSGDMTLKVWNVCDGTEIQTLKGHTDIIRDCKISDDGNIVVSASGSKR